VGLCAELPNLSWLAETSESALKGIRNIVADVIEDMKNNKEKIPEPIAIKNYSGKFMVRVPPDVQCGQYLSSKNMKTKNVSRDTIQTSPCKSFKRSLALSFPAVSLPANRRWARSFFSWWSLTSV
jgi:hypothetical protein